MDLFNDEEILKPKKKKTTIKGSTIIIVAIVLLSILCIITLTAIVYISGSILKITVDDQNASVLKDILIMEENNKVYIPIKKMGEYLQYDTYNGDYITRSEETTKCYIETKTKEELVSFTLDSNVLTRVVNGQTEQIKITEPIKQINGELCINSEAAQQAFNIKFNYNVQKNDITIYTLGYLYTSYSQYYQTQGYQPIEETFANKMAVLDGMLIVKGQNNYYGVITVDGETILETKYDSIEYFRKTSEFLVGSNNKKGIIMSDQKTKLQLTYDSIKRVTNKNDIFYVVEKSNLYGLLDSEGHTIIYPEYEQIGIDVSAYEKNGVTNGYILYNELVPVRTNGKWALFNISGKNVTGFIYDSFGCPNGNVPRTYGVIEIFDYNLIVANQKGKYNLITLEGKGLFNNYILDSVYITVSEGKNIYYISSGQTTKELISFLQENGVSKPTPID